MVIEIYFAENALIKIWNYLNDSSIFLLLLFCWVFFSLFGGHT